MLKLDFDFTTPEQSKELLELGVPEWTANCFMMEGENDPIIYSVPTPYNFTEWNVWGARQNGDKIIPIWTSGRITEIILRATDEQIDYMAAVERYDPIFEREMPLRLGFDKYRNILNSDGGVIAAMISDLETYKKQQRLDFSKLEDRK